MRSGSRSRTSRGFGNHNAQAAMVLLAMGIALGLGPAIQLARSGPAGAAAAAGLGLVIAAGPFALGRLFNAGYVDNGCLSPLLMLGAYFGIGFLAGRLEWPPEAKAAAILGATAFLPWAFYGGIHAAIRLQDRRTRPPEADPKGPA